MMSTFSDPIGGLNGPNDPQQTHLAELWKLIVTCVLVTKETPADHPKFPTLGAVGCVCRFDRMVKVGPTIALIGQNLSKNSSEGVPPLYPQCSLIHLLKVSIQNKKSVTWALDNF